MGAAAGHINHIYEEYNLKFDDILKIFSDINDQKIPAYEKFDGVNLFVTIKHGHILYARNKTQLSTPITAELLRNKFTKYPHLQPVIEFAIKTIEQEFNNTSQYTRIFNNGQCFLNVEILHPASYNVILYKQPNIIINNLFDLRTNTFIINNNDFKAMLTGLKYCYPPNRITSITIDMEEAEKLFKGLEHVTTLNMTLAQYIEVAFMNGIHKFIKIPPDPVLVKILLDRWVYDRKSVGIIHHDSDLVLKLKELESKSQKAIVNKILYPLKECILKIATHTLINIPSNFASPGALPLILSNFQTVVKQASKSSDLKDKIVPHLKLIQSLGGSKSFTPIEGIVFYNENSILKLTGIFAPLNQILGIIKYSR